MNSQELINILKREKLLKIIDDEVDIFLEIPHIAYIEVKNPGSKALLFTNPVDKKRGKKFDIPVLMNIFGSFKALEVFIGDIEKISDKIENYLHLKPPASFTDKIALLKDLFSLKYIFPKRLNKKGICQEIIKTGDSAKLSDIPVLTTWSKDGGPFITMGQVYTKSLDGSMNNLGMYRLQVFDDNTLGLHWQIHKDGSYFFDEYKKSGKKMPVSIAIGGDPLYIWCAQAPLPIGIFELLIYGFIKGKNAKMVKSITNDIYIPEDVDFVIEGYVDPDKFKTEGPFGDHTGYYTIEDKYPYLNVTAITHRKNPVYHATVVGKPPLEDKYMGYATERIFLPLLKTTAHSLIDYHMPENGVFHNLILSKIRTLYPGHAKQIMHAFWGVGQMSFVKHAIFVNEDAPELTDYNNIAEYILNRFDAAKNILITSGILDALDHSSEAFAQGSKLGIDITEEEIKLQKPEILNDNELLKQMREISRDVVSLKQYYINTANPVCFIAVSKNKNQKIFFNEIKKLYNYLKIVIVVDNKKNDLENIYMLIWRVANNIDAARDIVIKDDIVFIDGTDKNEFDNFTRKWPDDVECDVNVLENLKNRKLINLNEDIKKLI